MKKPWLTVLVVLIFFGFLALAFGLAIWSQRPTEIRSDAILELDLDRAYPEHFAFQPFTASFLETVPTLRSVVRAIDRAAEDDHVVAVVARVGTARMGLASVQELRDAIKRFRQSGKPAYAYADTFGEWRAANAAYYLASAFERVYLQPSGDVSLTGLLYETPFYRGLFDKLDVVPRMGQRYEYKNAVNSYTETSHTEPHREALQALADSQFEQIVAGIGEARELSVGEVRAIVDRSPLLGQEALDAGLVDRLAYHDQIYEDLSDEFDDVGFVSLSRYTRGHGRSTWMSTPARGRKVALIYGVGGVVRGDGGYDPLSGSQTMGSRIVAGAFRDAIDDSQVAAILFRVNSPGGSYVASDTIWRETIRARNAGKPVIVSMGDVAASGGYFVAMAADTIVAQPGTITGSIGVYGGKLLSRGMWGKVGITFDDVAIGERARIWSGNHDFGEGDRARIEASLDRIYDDFTTKVADGRSMSREEVHEIARGRVWTGADALERGLVDALGGYDVALGKVREALGLGDQTELTLEQFPRPKTPFELLSEGRFIGAEGRSGTLAALVEAAGPVVRLARELGILETPPAPLTVWPALDQP